MSNSLYLRLMHGVGVHILWKNSRNQSAVFQGGFFSCLLEMQFIIKNTRWRKRAGKGLLQVSQDHVLTHYVPFLFCFWVFVVVFCFLLFFTVQPAVSIQHMVEVFY